MDYLTSLRYIFGPKKGEQIAKEYAEPLSLVEAASQPDQMTDTMRRKIEGVLAFSRMYLSSKAEREIRKIKNPKDVYDLLAAEMEDLEKECFKVILLNTKNIIIDIKEITTGSLNTALVHPREVFKEAIKWSAAGIIMVHNHPSGNSKPSIEDSNLTTRFNKAGELLGIDLVDHVIIGKEEFTSIREEGVL